MPGKEPRRRGRKGITLEDVRTACERLEQQGRSVGPTNVRLELQRGSYQTIMKHLRALGRAGGSKR
jgi:hypothetical protein